MKLLVLIACLAFYSSALSVGAAPVSEEKGFEKATRSIWDWLRSMEQSLGKFVADEKRSQLSDELRRLNTALINVESLKRILLLDLRATRGSEEDIARMQQSAAILSQRIDELRTAITAVTAVLRENAKIGGDTCEEHLQEATNARKSWVMQLSADSKLLQDKQVRDEIVATGETAVASLRKASLELAKVIDQLSQRP